jgi:hypothetical protein
MAVAAVVLVTTGGHARHVVSVPLPSAPPLLPLLDGVPAQGAHSDLVLGGGDFWQAGRQPRAVVAAGILFNGLSPLLPHGHGAWVDQLAPVPGGVVAHISDISTGSTYGALGRVVFIPAATAHARVIAQATMIAVGPGGRQVWVQTAIQSVRNGKGVPASFRSPTWAVNLDGRRVSPVLHLPLGLVAATESGPLTQNLRTGQLQLWNGTNGRPIRMNLPADASFVAAGRDKVISWSCGGTCQLDITDLTTGTDAAVELPRTWVPPSETYPPPSASFDPSGQQLAFPLNCVDAAGTTTAENLFVADRDTARGPRQAVDCRLVSHDKTRPAGRLVGPAGAAVGAGDESGQRLLPARILDRRRAVAHIRARAGQPDDAVRSRIWLAAKGERPGRSFG